MLGYRSQVNIFNEDDPPEYLSRWLLKALSITVAGLCLYARSVAGAYLLLVTFPFYIAIAIVHFILHFRALRQHTQLSRALVKRLLLSHLFFIVAFLFQYDYAEAEWLVVTFLIFGPKKGTYEFEDYSWTSDVREWMGIILSAGMFVPVFKSWVNLGKSKVGIDGQGTDAN